GAYRIRRESSLAAVVTITSTESFFGNGNAMNAAATELAIGMLVHSLGDCGTSTMAERRVRDDMQPLGLWPVEAGGRGSFWVNAEPISQLCHLSIEDVFAPLQTVDYEDLVVVRSESFHDHLGPGPGPWQFGPCGPAIGASEFCIGTGWIVLGIGVAAASLATT